MFKIKLGIITVTKKGVEKALLIKEKLIENNLIEEKHCDIFTMKKFVAEGKEDKTLLIDGKLKDFFGKIYLFYNTFLFVTATGIAIRTIAPYIKSKDTDPAILSMDEGGNFVIPLLSGHLGKANERAKIIANISKSFPVITTASDVSGKIAVDSFAMKINSKLNSLEEAKKVTSLIISGKNVDIKIPQNMEVENPEGLILISNRKKIEISKIIPQNIVVGIGSKRGKEMKYIVSAIDETFEKLNLCKESIKCFATADIKKDEIGIIETAKFFDRELKIIDRKDILKIENNFESSSFVKKITGVGSISAPSAFIAGKKKGKFLAEKLKYDGITISIFELETRKI